MLESIVLGVTLLTPHFSSGFHTKTPGIYAIVDDSIVIGVVHNSIGNRSFYTGWKFDGPLKTDILVGGITGYPNRPVNPLLTIGKSWGPMRAQFIPPSGLNAAAVTFSLEWQIK
jgi:hypothetical protein